MMVAIKTAASKLVGAKMFLLVGVGLALVFHTVLFFPYAQDALVLKALDWYLSQLTRVCGWVIHFFDPTATTQQLEIVGRFSLRIVIDCAALDVQSLFVAAVLAFPATIKQRLLCSVLGCLAITMVNICRIVTLYLVGVHAPGSFKIVHEEVMAIAMVFAALLAFLSFIWWVHGPRRPRAAATSNT
jgi:exosortase/archaeosortase family protein